MLDLKKISVIAISILLLSGCSASSSKRTRLQHKTLESKQVAVSEPRVTPQFRKHALGKLAEVPASIGNMPLKNSYVLNPNNSFEVEVSDNGYTRFFIEGERITDIFVYPQESVAVQIHDQGYLVVMPQGFAADATEAEEAGDDKQKVYITITGEEGTTQDFSLRFAGKSPGPVRFVKSGSN